MNRVQLLDLRETIAGAAQRHPEDTALSAAVATLDAALRPRKGERVTLDESGYPINPHREKAKAFLDRYRTQDKRWDRVLTFIADHMPCTGKSEAQVRTILQDAASDKLLERIPGCGAKYHMLLCTTFKVWDAYDKNIWGTSPGAFVAFMDKYYARSNK